MARARGAVLDSLGCMLAGAGEPARSVERFEFTGGVQTWTAPAGVTRAQLTACGAQGEESVDLLLRDLVEVRIPVKQTCAGADRGGRDHRISGRDSEILPPKHESELDR